MPFFAQRIHGEAIEIIERGEARQYVIIASWWFVALLNRFASVRKNKEGLAEGAASAVNI